MATAANIDGERSFSIGTVLGRAFGVMGDNPIATFGIAFLFGALPQQLYSYFIQPMRSVEPGAMGAMVLVTLGSVVVSLFFSMLVQGALVRATMAYSEGSRASIGESLSVGIARLLPLLGVSVLMAIALIFGFMLLIVPAIILYMIWIVATPAVVAEDIGVVEAFGRSSYLTKGARWKIFGLQLLLLVVFWIVSAIVGVFMVMGGGMQTMASEMAAGRIPVSFLIMGAVSGTLLTAFWSTLQTSLYISLRDWKDGPQTEALADIFA